MVASYLVHAAAYVTASEFEGRPNAVLEALALGKVVLASDIPAHREIITDGENGLIFEMEHTTDAAYRLIQTLRNAEITQRLEEAARTSVKEFTWERCAIRYLSLFKTARG
jgi:glycosyltransferase involved in cell wall biosynthesis